MSVEKLHGVRRLPDRDASCIFLELQAINVSQNLHGLCAVTADYETGQSTLNARRLGEQKCSPFTADHSQVPCDRGEEVTSSLATQVERAKFRFTKLEFGSRAHQSASVEIQLRPVCGRLRPERQDAHDQIC